MALVAWPDVGECTETLTQFRAITGDDCYRPSQWLRLRRLAMPGSGATTLEQRVQSSWMPVRRGGP